MDRSYAKRFPNINMYKIKETLLIEVMLKRKGNISCLPT